MEKAVQEVLCCCGNCSINDFLVRGCPSSGKKLRKFPILDVSQLSNSEKMKLIARLLYESDRVMDEFATLLSETQCAFQKCVRVRELVVYLCGLQLSRFHENLADKKILKSFEKELCACADVSEVFVTLRDVWSWFNHSLLGKLISRFRAAGNNIKQKYDRYLANYLNPYLQQSVFKVPSDSYGPLTLPQFEKFIIKLDDDVVESFNVDLPKRMQLHVAQTLQIELEALILQSIHEGCFQVTFLIPGVAVDEVLPLSATCVTAFSHFEPMILRVECHGTITIIHQTQVPTIHAIVFQYTIVFIWFC